MRLCGQAVGIPHLQTIRQNKPGGYKQGGRKVTQEEDLFLIYGWLTINQDERAWIA